MEKYFICFNFFFFFKKLNQVIGLHFSWVQTNFFTILKLKSQAFIQINKSSSQSLLANIRLGRPPYELLPLVGYTELN